MITDDLHRGDYIDVFWSDPCLDETGDPTTATLGLKGHQPFRVASGRYWELKRDIIVDPRSGRGLDISVLVMTFSFDPDNPTQQGYRVIPEILVAGVEVIKRVKRAKKPRIKKGPPLNHPLPRQLTLPFDEPKYE